jgi:Arc/MetJ-type ribon-helix-helix transcriptional regulator
MPNRRAHVVIPDQLVAEIDRLVGKRSRSQFLVQAATFELKRQRQLAALRAATGAWKLENHPELAQGSVAYQRRLRAESERRLHQQAASKTRS